MAAPHTLLPGSIDSPHLDEAKRDIRRALRDRLRGNGPRALPDPRDAAIAARLSSLIETHDPAVLAGVWPLHDEPDLRPLLHRLRAAGRTILLPVVAGAGERLALVPWDGAGPPVGAAGTDAPAPSLLLVPLVAFDRRCNRLGRGGGHYDRTLASLPGAVAIGFAHAEREAAAIPTASHDVVLDAVVTEGETIMRPPPSIGSA